MRAYAPSERKHASPHGDVALPARSSGRELDVRTREIFESRFGHDFGRVRVHADGEAARSARGHGALAYTFGRDIVFGAGQYRPGTAEGDRLLAHELGHVVEQQGAEPSVQRQVDPSAAAGERGPSRVTSSDEWERYQRVRSGRRSMSRDTSSVWPICTRIPNIPRCRRRF